MVEHWFHNCEFPHSVGLRPPAASLTALQIVYDIFFANNSVWLLGGNCGDEGLRRTLPSGCPLPPS